MIERSFGSLTWAHCDMLFLLVMEVLNSLFCKADY
jgi:hypothetical protein